MDTGITGAKNPVHGSRMDMDIRFDLNEAQSNILEKYPEWRDLMAAVEFKNTPAADPTGYSGRTVYYNSRSLRQFPRDAQTYLIAQQLMHIQLAHQQRGEGKEPRIWDLACAAVVNEMLLADGFEPPVNIFRRKDAKSLSAEEVYDILYEKAERDDFRISEEEKPDKQSDTQYVAILKKGEKNNQAGDLQGAQNRDIEDPGLAKAVAGLADLLEPSMQLDYDWFPADRIRDGILIEQFRPYPVPHAEILLDTSASIDEDLLRAFVRGVREILQEDAVVKVGCFDTEFYGFQEIHSEKDISKLEIKGSGGTNFETAVRAFTGDAETK
ncbi:MAG: hypothetical protein IIY50_01580, partial [Mogibacterium sp.]|nr:hypothetical protein [Mogibacterium sp.]